ncbi:putative membrane protein [Synechococcus sp. A18-46.1]|nr:putative membrane protein [Synechococcus sp. A18-46.1]
MLISFVYSLFTFCLGLLTSFLFPSCSVRRTLFFALYERVFGFLSLLVLAPD